MDIGLVAQKNRRPLEWLQIIIKNDAIWRTSTTTIVYISIREDFEWSSSFTLSLEEVC